MENILLVFLNDLDNIDEYNEVLNNFDKNNFKIYVMEEIKQNCEFSPEQLPVYVEYYKSLFNEIAEISVLSNSKDLIFSWFRCYNSLVNNFIYFIDYDTKEYFDANSKHFDFYHNLYNFNQIEQEIIKGKIFINLNIDNFEENINFIIKDKNNIYFDLINNYNFMPRPKENKIISRKYKFNGFEYLFHLENSDDVHTVVLR